MTIRKVANRTTKLAVSATTTQAGIYKAAIVTAQTIKRIANASTSLVPKAHVVADQLIARLLLNPESSGLQNYYDFQYFADQLGLLLNRPARDSFSLTDELTTSFIIGRGQSYPGLRDRVFATDDRLGLLIRAKRTFTDAAPATDRPFLFVDKPLPADNVGFSDFILISRILAFADSIVTAEQLNRIVQFNRTFGDTVGMLDAYTLIDGSTYSLNRSIIESPLLIGSGIDQRSSSAERISFILDKVLDPDMELLDQLSKNFGKGVVDTQSIAERKFLRLGKQLADVFDLGSIASRRIIKFNADQQHIDAELIRFDISKSLADATIMIDNMALGDDLTYDSTKLLADFIIPLEAKQLAVNKRFNDAEVIADATAHTLAKTADSDSIAESDVPVKFFDKFNRDNFSLAERIIIGRFKNFVDSITPTEDPAFYFAKLLRDTVSATDPFVVLSDGIKFYGIVSKQETEPIADQFQRRIDFIRYPHHPGFRDLAPALDRSQFSPYPAKLFTKDAKSSILIDYPVLNATTTPADTDRVYAGTYLRSPLYSTQRFSGDSLENISFILDKPRDDNFTPSDFFARSTFINLSGNIAGTGLSGSSNTIIIGDPAYAFRYSGNETEQLIYTIALAAKQGQGTVYNFSGNTVTAYDSDRLFVGNSYERVRMSGSLQERVDFDITMVARQGLGTRTVLELGINNDPTADANQVSELFYNKPSSIYGKNWFQLAPLYASFVHESTTDYSLDRVLVGSRFANMPRLVGDAFENFSYVLNKDFRDTTLMLDSTDLGDRSTFDFIDREFDTITLGRDLGFRVSGDLIERTDFVFNLRAQAGVDQVISGYRHFSDEFNAYDVYVTKADSDRAVAFDDFSRQWTVNRTTADTVRIGTDTGFRRSGFDLENFSLVLDKVLADRTLMLDSTDLGDRSTFDFIDREFDTLIIGRNEGYRVSGDDQEKMGMVLAKDAKRGLGTNQQLIFAINNFTTADANQINEIFYNQPANPYADQWFQLAPYSSTYLYETDLENDHDRVLVGSRFSNTRKLSGDPFETIDVTLNKRLNDSTLMLDSTDLADRLTFDWFDVEADVITPTDFFARAVNFVKIAQVDVAYTITGIRSSKGSEEELVSFTVPARSDTDYVFGFDEIVLFNSQLRVLGPDDVFIGTDDGFRKYLGLETISFFIDKSFFDDAPITSYIGIPDGLNFDYYADKTDRVTLGLSNPTRVSGSAQENASFLITMVARRGLGTYNREVFDMGNEHLTRFDANQILELFYNQPSNPYGNNWYQLAPDDSRYIVYEEQDWNTDTVYVGSKIAQLGFIKLAGDPYETIDVRLTKAVFDSFNVGKTADVYGLQTNLEQTTTQFIKGLNDNITEPDFFRRNVDFVRTAFVDAAYSIGYLINGGGNDETAITATVPKNSPTDRVFAGDYIIAFNAQFRGLGPDFVFIGRQSDPGLYHPNTVVLLNVRSEALFTQDSSRNDPKTLTTTGIYNSDSPFNSSVARLAASQLFELFYNYETDYYNRAWYDPTTAGAGSIELTTSSIFTINNWGNRSDKQLGTDSFTIETWVKFTQDTSSGQIVLANHAPGIGAGLDIAIYNGNLVYNLSSTGSTPNIAQSSIIGTVVANTWYHVALVRNSDSITGYLDGIAGATVTSTASIYYDQNAVLRSALTGRLSNLRVVQGTAEYTGAFTVPITPLRNTYDSNRLARRYSGESLENFSYVLNKDFYDSTLMLDSTNLGDRLTFDWFDVEADTVNAGLPDGPRVSGSAQENAQFLITYRARASVNTAVSGTTVTAADTDRLFLGTQIAGTRRLAGDGLETISFYFAHPVSDTTIMLDSTDLGDRSTFDFIDREFDTITLGLPDAPKVSGSNLERQPFTFALDAKAGTEHVIDGYIDAGQLYRDPTFDANQLFETNLVSYPNTYYNETWFSLVPTAARSEASKLYSSTTVTARDRDRLVAFDDFSRIVTSFLVPRDTVTVGRSEGLRVSYSNQERTTFLITKQLYDSSTLIDSTTFADRLTFYWADQEFDTVTAGLPVIPFKVAGTNLERIPFTIAKNALQSINSSVSGTTVTAADTDRLFVGQRWGTIRLAGDTQENLSYFLGKQLRDTATMLDSTTFADRLTFDWFDVEADTVTLGRSEGRRVSGSNLERTSITYALDAKASVAETKTGLISFGAAFRDPGFAASQLLELFYNQPNNPYETNWYDLGKVDVADSYRYDTYNEVLTSIGIAAKDQDRVVMFDSFKRDWSAFKQLTDAVVPGRSEGKRVSYSAQEQVSFLITKQLYDGSTIIDSTTFADRLTFFWADQEADTVTLGLLANPAKVSGSDLERQPFFISKTAKQSINNEVSGTTVTAADTDRLFVGQRWGSIRLSGDNQERFSYILNKPLRDTTTMLDSTTFADRLTFDWFDVEADTITLGRSEGLRVSGSNQERTSMTLAIDAKAGVDHTITGILDIGFLYRDRTFDANQLVEIRDNTISNDYYNSTWYSPVPYYARSQTETLLSSTSVRARDQDRLVIFDRIEFIKLSLINELDFVTIGSGRGKRVSGDNIENVKFYITKVLADTAPMLDSTNLGDRLTYFLADQEADTVSIGTGIDSKTGFNNLERLNFDVIKGRGDSITAGLPDAPRVSGSDVERIIFLITKLISDVTTMVDSFDFADRLTYALLDNEADNITVTSRINSKNIQLIAKQSVNRSLSGNTVTAADQERVFMGSQPASTNATFNANQVMNLFYVQPQNPYGVGWYSEVPGTELLNRAARKSGDALENISFILGQVQPVQSINTTDSFDSLYTAKRPVNESVIVSDVIVPYIAKLVYLDDSILITNPKTSITFNKARGRGEFVQSATPTQDANQIMGLFYNRPGSAYGTNWYTDRGLTDAQQTGFAPSADINIVSSQGFLRTTNYIGLDYIAEDYVGASTVFT